MKRLLAIAFSSLMLVLAGCSDDTAPSSDATSESASPTVTATSTLDTSAPASTSSMSPEQEAGDDAAAYLVMVRKDTADTVDDARLVQIGESFCTDLRAGKWDATTIDDESIVGDLSVQMRINIGFAAARHLCPEQEAEYIRKAGAALGGG